jgi:fatty acid desaturase
VELGNKIALCALILFGLPFVLTIFCFFLNGLLFMFVGHNVFHLPKEFGG